MTMTQTKHIKIRSGLASPQTSDCAWGRSVKGSESFSTAKYVFPESLVEICTKINVTQQRLFISLRETGSNHHLSNIKRPDATVVVIRCS